MGRGVEPIRLFTLAVVAMLCAIAAIGIALVITNSNENDAAGKVVPAAVVLTVFSLAAMAGIVLAVRRPAIAWFGYATTALAVLAFALLTRKIWDTGLFLGGEDWKLPGVGTIVALACGQISLLLAWARDGAAARWIALGAALAITAIAVLGVLTIAIDDVEVGARVYGVLAIVYLLGIALLPLLTLTEQGDAESAPTT
jgi:hypothetical protein